MGAMENNKQPLILLLLLLHLLVIQLMNDIIIDDEGGMAEGRRPDDPQFAPQSGDTQPARVRHARRVLAHLESAHSTNQGDGSRLLHVPGTV